MSNGTSRQSARIGLRFPLMVLVLAFTAIPIELRPFERARLANIFVASLDMPDIVANILGYVPFGFLFASSGKWVTFAVSTSVSVLAETTQVISKSRSPALIDVATNVLGAAIGLGIVQRWKPAWKTKPPELLADRRAAAVAATLALGYVGFGTNVTPRQIEETVMVFSKTPRLFWLDISPRGSAMDGRLEAEWTFEDMSGEVVVDVSGNGLNGRLVNAPRLEDGIHGRSLRLNGINQYVDLGHPTPLRLTGSETIIAWIKASSFPVDDAAVVSSHSGLGYQLDTTVDRGSRTIGFKLADAQGRLMARYGRTPLLLRTWYHIAGVYDARLQTLDVYLNGEKDNGCLLGTVKGRQQISGMNTYIGKRASANGFEFAGSIDDVRIYSRALTPGEIEADFKASPGARPIPAAAQAAGDSDDVRCGSQNEEEAADSRSIGLIVTLGLLVSLVVLGCLPTVSRRTLFLVCFAIGFSLFPTMAAAGLSPGYKWLLPLLTLAGGASVAFSIQQRNPFA